MGARDVEMGTHFVMAEPGWCAVFKSDDGTEHSAPVWAWIVRVRRVWLHEGRLSDDLSVEVEGLEAPDAQECGEISCSVFNNFVRYERGQDQIARHISR